jgi:hypothetical protein
MGRTGAPPFILERNASPASIGRPATGLESQGAAIFSGSRPGSHEQCYAFGQLNLSQPTARLRNRHERRIAALPAFAPLTSAQPVPDGGRDQRKVGGETICA